MRSAAQKKKILLNKQVDFFTFVQQNLLPTLEEEYHFDYVQPNLEADDIWDKSTICFCIPHSEQMEPYLSKFVEKSKANPDTTIVCVLGVKTSTHAWENYVFPYASAIDFVIGGKRPTAIVVYSKGCQSPCTFRKSDGIWGFGR